MYRKYVWWKIVILSFLAAWTAYLIRMCLSQAILPMSETFGWTEREQGKLFSAFYYGYLLTQVPGGWLSQRFGAKWVILSGILGSALLNAAVPWAAHQSFTAVLLLRGLIGFVQGVFWPSCLHLLACWMEASHASLAVAIVISGHHLGTATAQGAYPIIAEKSSWEAPFYLIGIIGCLWALLWMNLINSNPPPYFEEEFEETPRLSDIKLPPDSSMKSMPGSASMSRSATPVASNLDVESFNAPSATPFATIDEEPFINDEFEPLIMSFYSSGTSDIPWFRYFTYSAVWAYFFVFFAYNWSFYLLVSYLPKFLTSILGFSMKEAGQVGLWAYLGLYVSILVGGRLNSYFISKGYSPSLVRKVGVSLGLMPPIVLVLIITLPWCHLTTSQIASALLLSIALTGLAQSSFAPNPIDLSPSSPAFIASLGNMVATLPGIFSSLFTGHVLQEIGHCQPSRSNAALLLSHTAALPPPITDDCYAAWMLIFRVCVAVYFLGWMVWLFFASARPLKARPSLTPLHP